MRSILLRSAIALWSSPRQQAKQGKSYLLSGDPLLACLSTRQQVCDEITQLFGCCSEACSAGCVCDPAGGLLVVPVLQPKADNIPFGLALSLQSRFCASVCEASVEEGQQDLYELQYVLEGTGQASARSFQQLQNCAVLS